MMPCDLFSEGRPTANWHASICISGVCTGLAGLAVFLWACGLVFSEVIAQSLGASGNEVRMWLTICTLIMPLVVAAGLVCMGNFILFAGLRVRDCLVGDPNGSQNIHYDDSYIGIHIDPYDTHDDWPAEESE